MRDKVKDHQHFETAIEDNIFDLESTFTRLKKYHDDEPIKKVRRIPGMAPTTETLM